MKFHEILPLCKAVWSGSCAKRSSVLSRVALGCVFLSFMSTRWRPSLIDGLPSYVWVQTAWMLFPSVCTQSQCFTSLICSKYAVETVPGTETPLLLLSSGCLETYLSFLEVLRTI